MSPPTAFLALFGSPPDMPERLQRTRWRYQYARVDPDQQDPVAVFEFVAEIEVDLDTP